MSNKDSATQVSSGVEALIQRLRDEGVEQGRSQAQKILEEAEARAKWLVEQAEDEAQHIVSKAREESERLEKSALEAMDVAARDAMLDLKSKITSRFTAQVRRLISDEMKKTQTLRHLILQIAGRARGDVDTSKDVDIYLPREIIDLEEFIHHPEEVHKGHLDEFIRLINADGLREGVQLKVADEEQCGIRIYLKDQAVNIDLTDEAVGELLLQHLQPRFRALLEGIVK
jgi:V/A-type H+-transporting ATPase subunit E